MDAAVSTRREPRAAVSLRLPPELIRVVERYATEHRLSKTDAFLHFLTQGIAAEGAARTPAPSSASSARSPRL